MNDNILNLNNEKIKRNLALFSLTGYIDESLLQLSHSSIGGESLPTFYRLKARHKCYLEEEYNTLLNTLETTHVHFKYPTTLCHYRRGINPVIAMHQEHQRALYKEDINKFSIWIMDLVEEQYDIILNAIDNDIDRIERFIKEVDKINYRAESTFMTRLLRLLNRLKVAKVDFIQAS